LRECLKYAKNDLRDNEACIVLRWGAMALLLSCERNGICKASNRIRHQPAFVQAFLSPIIPESEFTAKGTIAIMLTSQIPESALSAITPLYEKGKKLVDLGLRLKEVNPIVQNTLKEMGLVGRRFSIKTDQISDILVRMYSTNPTLEWRSILSAEYIHTLSILIQAERMYLPASSIWLQFQNSFNDAVLRSFLTFLLTKNIPGGKLHSNKFGALIDIGVLLDPLCQFSKTYPIIADCFRAMNARRNRLPGSHPYDKKTGQQTTFLKAQERNRFTMQLKDAFDNIISIFETNK
jgi:hypothetical protein